MHDKKGFNLFPPIFLLNLCNLDSLKYGSILSFDFTIGIRPEWGYPSMIDTFIFYKPLKLLVYELWPIIGGDTPWQTIGEKHTFESSDNVVSCSRLQNLYFHISAVVV